MPPRDIRTLLEYLKKNGQFGNLTNNLLAQWGPQGRQMLGAQFLPPRVVENNQDTLEDVRLRTVAAVDGTRYSPAQLVDAGEMFGKISYRFGHSDLARQITGPDYDGVVSYLNRNMSMQAAGVVLGIFDAQIVQGMVEHDELAAWEAIVYNKLSRRGDNGYYSYEDGPDLTGHRVPVGGDWTDPAYDPWAEDIIPRIKFLVSLGYDRGGIRIVTSDAVIQVLADHPSTARRAYAGQPLFTGQTLAEVAPVTTDADVAAVFRKLRVQVPITHDLRIFTKTGQVRAYPEDHMTFIASTGRSEEVRFNVDNIEDVKIVNDVLGFFGIGRANGQQTAGRRSAVRSFTDQKDARIELEGWQATGPVILDPQAIADLSGIELGA